MAAFLPFYGSHFSAAADWPTFCFGSGSRSGVAVFPRIHSDTVPAGRTVPFPPFLPYLAIPFAASNPFFSSGRRKKGRRRGGPLSSSPSAAIAFDAG